ncbi:MAG: hypothetical protein Q4A05_12120, partial [Ruminococcus sp.]|nr:hypothetical protein [Ruminococcus sp.]
MKEENRLPELLNDPLLRDYLSLNDRLIRLVASRISAESEIIRNKVNENKPLEGETERILAMCSRLMQVSELYSMLTGVIADEPYLEAVELSEFVGGFTKKCSELLDGVCSFEAAGADGLFVDTSRDVLTYILLSFVRNSILSGAETVRLEYGSSDGKCCISAASKLVKKSGYERFGDFQRVHGDEIIAALAARIGADCETTESSVKLTFTASETAADSELRSPRHEYEASLFSEYNIMLGDLAKG